MKQKASIYGGNCLGAILTNRGRTPLKYFLSYKRENLDDVKIIASVLMLHGVSIWQDINHLNTGLTERQIQKAIQNECSGLVFLSTKESVRSLIILKVELPEAEQRVKKGPSFHILPIFKQGVKETDNALSGAVTIPLSNYHGVVITKPRNKKAILKAAYDSACLILKSAKFNLRKPLLISMTSRHNLGKDVSLAINLSSYFTMGMPSQDIWNNEFKSAFISIRNNLALKKMFNLKLFCFAPLSLGLLFGYIFRETTGFTLEVKQRSANWATSAKKGRNPLKCNISPGNDVRSKNLLVKIDLISSGDAPLRSFIKTSKIRYRALIEFDPPSYPCHISKNQANIIAHEVASKIKQTNAKSGTNKVHLFLAGPFGLALFIGYYLNACGLIQCYEYNNANCQYSPSCILG